MNLHRVIFSSGLVDYATMYCPPSQCATCGAVVTLAQARSEECFGAWPVDPEHDDERGSRPA